MCSMDGSLVGCKGQQPTVALPPLPPVSRLAKGTLRFGTTGIRKKLEKEAPSPQSEGAADLAMGSFRVTFSVVVPWDIQSVVNDPTPLPKTYSSTGNRWPDLVWSKLEGCCVRLPRVRALFRVGMWVTSHKPLEQMKRWRHVSTARGHCRWTWVSLQMDVGRT